MSRIKESINNKKLFNIDQILVKEKETKNSPHMEKMMTDMTVMNQKIDDLSCMKVELSDLALQFKNLTQALEDSEVCKLKKKNVTLQ